jgi:tellurite resistance protein TehA-like permease
MMLLWASIFAVVMYDLRVMAPLGPGAMVGIPVYVATDERLDLNPRRPRVP